MSADTHGHGHDHHADTGGHSTRRGYLIGFFLSVVLTAIPFWMVMTHALAPQTTALVIMGFALVQVIVHMIYFLHMNSRAEGGWSMMAMIFTVILVVITLIGSLWVMYNMNLNMMPGMTAGDTSGM